MPALLLHFILQHRTPRRSLGIDLWGPTYLALVITLAFTTRNFREPMAWAEFGPIREFTSTVTLTLKDRKSTRLHSSHVAISYAVFRLKNKSYVGPPAANEQ